MKVYRVKEELTSPKFAQAWHEGTGWEISDGAWDGGAWAGFGSPKNWHDYHAAIAAGQDCFYGDKGYFGRGEYYRITKNALFHTGRGISDCKRFDKFRVKINSWRRGSYIVICPQSEGFFSLRLGVTQDEWLSGIISEINKHTDRAIKVHYKNDKKPLSEMLKGAWAVVSYSSNSNLEALADGVPAYSLGKSHVSSLCLNDLSKIETPYYPENRREHFGVLADNQWTLEEIKRGNIKPLWGWVTN